MYENEGHRVWWIGVDIFVDTSAVRVVSLKEVGE